MSSTNPKGRIQSIFSYFLNNEASGGIILMFVAALAIIIANSSFSETYFNVLHIYVGTLSVQHWINDALMAVFFLLVGLEIKREMIDGQLSSWSRRVLPGAAALGGMVFPAAFYIYFNWNEPSALRGWAIPMATDIAFALGVLSLFGKRVPTSLKIFLAALAIIDDLGAVIVIALFYTAEINILALVGAALITSILISINRMRVDALFPYLVLGAVLWVLVFASGVHATLAGVILALTIPLKTSNSEPNEAHSDAPLIRLEHKLVKPVAFLVVPIFGFANAGVSFAGVSLSTLAEPLTMGVAAGLIFGKLVGVLGTVAILVKLKLAELPAQSNWLQMTGIALLCGIGFTMSLFIGLLAFNDPIMQDQAKIGILLGSLIAGLAGSIMLTIAGRRT